MSQDRGPYGRQVIGIDLDNTLAMYDDVVHSAAVQRGLIQPQVNKSKREVRDAIRALPGGEIEWQKVQGVVYGPGMGGAKLAEGASAFIQQGNRSQVKFYIVSHRTMVANYDETRTNLRQSALTWMTKNGFFEADGLDLSREDVFFEPTRHDKIRRIERLGCTHFIDDLEEVFLAKNFPSGTCRILYAPSPPPSAPIGVSVATTWKEIGNLVFGVVGEYAG